MGDTRTLFKTACDACSRSKIKCSGGNPCESCKKKGIECVYAFKKKRGPKNPDKIEKSGEVKTSAMSSYERRIWSVFFTIFKNQKRHAKDNPFSWGWFVAQLRRLEAYVTHSQTSKGERLNEILESFYQSMELGKSDLKDALKINCPIPPHLCPICSASALGNDSTKSQYIDGPHVHHVSEINDQNNGHNHNIDGFVMPKPTAVRSNEKIEDYVRSDFDKIFDKNKKACLIFETDPCNFGVFVNNAFKEKFGYDNDEMNQLMIWSGGGFLPFGGDVLAALLVYESDLLLYLQIMSFKYQAQGLPSGYDYLKIAGSKEKMDAYFGKDGINLWTIPSINVFQCWLKNSITGLFEPKMIQFSCNVRQRWKSKVDVGLRLEFVLLEENVGGGLFSISDKVPERITHGAAFNNVEENRKRLRTNTNNSFWTRSTSTGSSGSSMSDKHSEGLNEDESLRDTDFSVDATLNEFAEMFVPEDVRKAPDRNEFGWDLPTFNKQSFSDDEATITDGGEAESEPGDLPVDVSKVFLDENAYCGLSDDDENWLSEMFAWTQDENVGQ